MLAGDCAERLASHRRRRRPRHHRDGKRPTLPEGDRDRRRHGGERQVSATDPPHPAVAESGGGRSAPPTTTPTAPCPLTEPARTASLSHSPRSKRSSLGRRFDTGKVPLSCDNKGLRGPQYRRHERHFSGGCYRVVEGFVGRSGRAWCGVACGVGVAAVGGRSGGADQRTVRGADPVRVLAGA